MSQRRITVSQEAITARRSKKRQPPIRIPTRLLAHMRRWRKNGQAYLIEFNGAPIGSIDTVPLWITVAVVMRRPSRTRVVIARVKARGRIKDVHTHTRDDDEPERQPELLLQRSLGPPCHADEHLN
jgi:hypothetical protein